MYLKHKTNGDLVEILSMDHLINPTHANVVGRYHVGEELQEPEEFAKANLVFPSGEALPRCWKDPNYKS